MPNLLINLINLLCFVNKARPQKNSPWFGSNPFAIKRENKSS